MGWWNRKNDFFSLTCLNAWAMHLVFTAARPYHCVSKRISRIRRACIVAKMTSDGTLFRWRISYGPTFALLRAVAIAIVRLIVEQREIGRVRHVDPGLIQRFLNIRDHRVVHFHHTGASRIGPPSRSQSHAAARQFSRDDIWFRSTDYAFGRCK